jgi:hypothetical protein
MSPLSVSTVCQKECNLGHGEVQQHASHMLKAISGYNYCVPDIHRPVFIENTGLFLFKNTMFQRQDSVSFRNSSKCGGKE